MGNPKMRFSQLLPNANSWFRKSTKTTTKNHPKPPPISSAAELPGDLPLSLSPPRKSYHFTRSLISPKSPELKPSIRRIRTKPTTTTASSSNSRNSRANSVISDDQSVFSGRRKTGEAASSVSSVELRPIKTEREKFSDLVKKIGGTQEAIDEKRRSSGKCRGRRRANGSFSITGVKEDSAMAASVSSFKKEHVHSPVKRSPKGSPRVRIRINSPRIARRVQVHATRGSSSGSPSGKGVSSKSLAVVKSSSDPQRDFRESMVEMIVENNIRSSKDLEELLACYLSLNSDQYHDVIIEAFAQIWFDLNKIKKEIKK